MASPLQGRSRADPGLSVVGGKPLQQKMAVSLPAVWGKSDLRVDPMVLVLTAVTMPSGRYNHHQCTLMV